MDAWGVHEDKLRVRQILDADNAAARRLRFRRSYRCLRLEDSVQEGGLADVGHAHYPDESRTELTRISHAAKPHQGALLDDGRMSLLAGDLQPQAQLTKLLQTHLRRGITHQINGLVRLGKGDDIADRVRLGENHDDTVEPEGNPPVWRRSKAEGLDEKAELSLRFIGTYAEHVENLALHVPTMDTNAAAGYLAAIQNQVVGLRLDALRTALEQMQVLILGRRKGMMHRYIALLLLAVLEERKVCNPQEVILTTGD